MDNDRRYCPYCGREQLFDDVTCPYCGHSLNGVQKNETVQQKADRQRAAIRKGWTSPREMPEESCDTQTVVQSYEKKKRKSKERRFSLGGILPIVITMTCILTVISVQKSKYPDPVSESDQSSYKPSSAGLYQKNVQEWEEKLAADAEEDPLDPDALWRHPGRWQPRFPAFTDQNMQTLYWTASSIKMYLSREEVVKKLDNQSVSREEAEEMLDILEVNWELQALRSTKDLLKKRPYAPKTLREELQKKQFTEAEVQYALENCGTDWNRQLDRMACQTMQRGAHSEKELRNLLVGWEFSSEDVDRYLEGSFIDFGQHAIRRLQYLRREKEVTWEEGQKILQEEGFTAEQIEHAGDALGFSNK